MHGCMHACAVQGALRQRRARSHKHCLREACARARVRGAARRAACLPAYASKVNLAKKWLVQLGWLVGWLMDFYSHIT